ncbi:helix-turn-helix domain-containing protein [Lactiplantibacillus pentosus]|uniref:Helix-turn-helix transcriptional regulator n=2 Tax=Lactiplantibacillus pentosus TaxID=1589 RepID=A0AAW8WBC8_LACPE|nr:helix-turn-helix transcriptional regulator [Lactiplantibacillus pentosus]MBU7553113.1 helix-turn-helix transcriptional regulator [Lactiplantibacillus pentosus]MDT7037867.1 helix-turn-helix transcriptional regulator [Lactiplantibacillus pentosus]
MVEIQDNEIITNHLKEILDERHISIKTFVDYAVRSGISRSAIYKIAANTHYNIQEITVHKLQRLLGVSYEKLISWAPNMSTYFNDNPRGFTQENLEILSHEMRDIGIQLHYQVYSRKESMNVTTMYAQNRRIYLDGNFRIDTSGLPELMANQF